MKAITVVEGVAAFLDRNNIDTDAIIPKQFMKSVKRTGFGQYLFDEWRYLDKGDLGMDCTTRPLNPEFELNFPQAKGAKVLITRRNFGCGSSREHAPWALLEYGFEVIIAASFAEIFRSNCLKNGILPVVLPEDKIDQLFRVVDKATLFKVDLNAQEVIAGELKFSFEMDAREREKLLFGLDDIALTLQHADAILRFEEQRFRTMPWLRLV